MSDEKKKKEKLSTWKPIEGYAWNPLFRLGRNSPCPCGSGIKFKKCHLNLIDRVVPKEAADSVINAVRVMTSGGSK